MSAFHIAHPLRITARAVAATLFAVALPVGSGPGSIANTPTIQASHVFTCNVSFDAAGNLLIDGATLTPAEAALLETLMFSDRRLASVLVFAADPDAEACVHLILDIEAQQYVIFSADLLACGEVIRDGELVMVGGAEVNAVLQRPDFLDALRVAAAANVDACAIVTVTNEPEIGGSYYIQADVALCAFTTFLADLGDWGDYTHRSRVAVNVGGEEFVFDVVLIDPNGLLQLGVGRHVKLVTGSRPFETATAALSFTVSECPSPVGRAGPAPAPTVGTGVVADTTSPPLLPNTAMSAVGMGWREAVN